MRYLSTLLIPVTALCGCDMLVSSEDAKLKASLTGSWAYESKGTQGRSLRGLLEQAENGTFTLTEKLYGVETPMAQKSAGEWHITQGLHKLRTTQIDGRRLGTSQMLYATCRIGEVTKFGFFCNDQIAKVTYLYNRVEEGSSLP
ncbi:MAG: hypothetical protein JWR60_878 [Polaromonas sp.]|nr:hypothetical protein [Polaromonas sp.]